MRTVRPMITQLKWKLWATLVSHELSTSCQVYHHQVEPTAQSLVEADREHGRKELQGVIHPEPTVNAPFKKFIINAIVLECNNGYAINDACR